jgi:hypothetical protein
MIPVCSTETGCGLKSLKLETAKNDLHGVLRCVTQREFPCGVTKLLASHLATYFDIVLSRGRNDHAQIEDAPLARPLLRSAEASPPSQISAIDPLQLIRSLEAESLQTHATSALAVPAAQPGP